MRRIIHSLGPVALAAVALATAAVRVSAQYPNVPPPIPCMERGAEWDASLLEPLALSHPSRVGLIPFRSSLSDADSANTSLVMAYSGQVAERLSALHPVLVWRASPELEPPETNGIIALGKSNHVPYLVFGRLDAAPHGITLTIRMYETVHGALVWNPVLTGVLSDLLGFEEVLVRGISDHTGAPPEVAGGGAARASSTISSLAYLHYLRGAAELASGARGSAADADEEFQGAVRLDSAYGAAWGGIALSTVVQIQREGLASQNAVGAATDVAVSAIRRAVRLAPQSGAVWVARGAVYELIEPREYTRALAAYLKAIDVSAWNPDAHLRLGLALAELGQPESAYEQYRLALAEDRGDPGTLVAIGMMHLRARRYHDACRALNAAVANEPRYGEAYAQRALVRLHLKDLRSAYGDAETGARLGAWLTGAVAQVIADADARDTASGRQRIADLTASWPRGLAHPSVWVGRYLAEGYVALGKDDRAMELLTHATPRGASLWLGLQDPSFDRLHGLVRYATLVQDSHPLTGGP
jgi:tetratricopeptide (TPR) repeat protein